MKKLREDIQLVAAMATIAVAVGALISWMTRWSRAALLTCFGAAGALVLLVVLVGVFGPWLLARYREPDHEPPATGGSSTASDTLSADG